MHTALDHILLSPTKMLAAEQAAVRSGSSVQDLMERAGQAVAEAVAQEVLSPYGCDGPILVLCGPGQNGGDGFVVARYLREWGYAVELVLLGDAGDLTGAARINAERWDGPIYDSLDLLSEEPSVVIDALFGAGLDRPLDGKAALFVEFANEVSGLKVAVDLPSGVNGSSGVVSGVCFQADMTVTFGVKKPGHVIAPGRFYCGGLNNIVVADIGLSRLDIMDAHPQEFHNIPQCWDALLPHAGPATHKYDRGNVLVLGGKEPTLGASRLAALAALRGGAGLVTLAAPEETYQIQAIALTDVLVRRFDGDADFLELLASVSNDVVLLGPGSGVGEQLANIVKGVVKTGLPTVLDADALTCLVGHEDWLSGRADSELVLTPHAGEFKRLFPDLDPELDRIEAARAAAKRVKAVVVLKGVSTVIACPDGRVAINTNAPATLSVGGTGDVLAGLVASLLAQGMPAFEAASAAVWIQGEAAMQIGKGLIASDLLEKVGSVLP